MRLRAPGRPSLRSLYRRQTYIRRLCCIEDRIYATHRPKNFRGSVQYCDIARPPKVTVMKAEHQRGEEGQVIHSTHQEIWRLLGSLNKAELSHHLRVRSRVKFNCLPAPHSNRLRPCLHPPQPAGKAKIATQKPADDEWEDDSQY
ncbi:hypothetical protein V8E54_007601 [Elaphomyces granulatus]